MKEATAPQPTITCRREPLLDSRQTAERLGISRHTLAIWRTKNFGPGFFLMGRKICFDPSEIDAFINSRRRTSTLPGLSTKNL